MLGPQSRRRINRLASLFIDYPFAPLKNQVGINSRNQRIAPMVIQTWEENNFGKRHLASMQKFRNRNSDLSFTILDALDRDSFMDSNWGRHPINEIYHRAKFGPLKADIFRYCFVHTNGGYYFDISKGMDCAITRLHDSTASELITFEGTMHDFDLSASLQERLLRPRHLFVQWAFGFAREHPILSDLIESIVKRFPHYEKNVFQNPKSAILKLTGPEAFTLAVHDYMSANPDTSVNQLDFDFEGHGIYALRGAGARHRKYPSYELVKDSSLFI